MSEPGVCRVCGCTDLYGCPDGCWWVEPDLCSQCDGMDDPIEHDMDGDYEPED